MEFVIKIEFYVPEENSYLREFHLKFRHDGQKKALGDINLYVAYVFVYKSHPEVCV